jgi:phage tail sheath gpL-like
MATTVPVDRKTPIIAFEVLLSQGPVSPGTGQRKVLAFGPYDSTITSTVVNEPVRPSNADDAAVRFGSGRALHRMVEAALDEWRGVTMFCVPTADGVGATLGTDTFTITGTATETKTMVLRFGNVSIPISVPNTTTKAALGALITAAIVNTPLLPVTGAYVDGTPGTYTLTFKDKGPNSAHGKWMITNIPAGITITATSGTMDAGTVEPKWSDAYAAAFASSYRWTYVVPACNDVTALSVGTGNLRGRISDAALASVDKRMQVILGHCGIETAAATLADAFDLHTVASSEPGWRFQCVWGSKQYEEPYVMAARIAARRALEESLDPNANWCGYYGAVLASSGFLPTPLQADYPLDEDIEAALNAGVTPIRYNAETQTGSVVLSITCKWTTGSAEDYRAMTTNKITVCDVIATDLRDYLGAKFNGFKIKADVATTGDPPEKLPPKTITPSLGKDEVMSRLRYYQDEKGWIEDVESLKDSVLFQRNDVNPMRADLKVPVSVVPWNTQLLGDVAEVSA